MKYIMVVLALVSSTLLSVQAYAQRLPTYIGQKHLLVIYKSPAKLIDCALSNVKLDKKAGTLVFQDRTVFFGKNVRYVSMKADETGSLLIITSYNNDNSHDTMVVYDGKIMNLDTGIPYAYKSDTDLDN